MKKSSKVTTLCLFALLLLFFMQLPVFAASKKTIDKKVELALQTLAEHSPAARELATIAKGVLVFPDIIKGGLIVGGQYGEGALVINKKIVGYYNTVAASYGLQIGAQSFGFAMFFMTDSALQYLNKSSGWEVGVGPSVVMVDQGISKSLTTSTAKEDIYTFSFSQQGLMAGLGLQGSKITKIHPKP
jgi:lipid-binding SYLF domain-containing protein